MQLDLENCWFDFAVGEDVSEGSDANIAETNILNQTFFDEFFHGFPSLSHWYWVFLHSWFGALWIMNPLRRISLFEWDKLKGDWEMN